MIDCYFLLVTLYLHPQVSVLSYGRFLHPPNVGMLSGQARHHWELLRTAALKRARSSVLWTERKEWEQNYIGEI